MIEIERKFLVKNDDWPQGDRQIVMRQGYLAQRDGLVCRVRQKNDVFLLSVKARIDHRSSYDYEYPIPAEDGAVMLEKLCERAAISKTRHEVKYDNLVWEIDEFHGANQGLIVAEIELPAVDHPLNLPPWVSEEVTDDQRYTNAALYETPWSSWSQEPPGN